MPVSSISFALPEWLSGLPGHIAPLRDPESRMRFVVGLARQTVARGIGGPFAAAVFEADAGRLVSVGVNLVEREGNSVLHAEVVALMFAQSAVASYTLSKPGLPAYELITSGAPCAMCLGAVLWSGVRRLVYAARKEDVEAIGFDEGPVFAESYAHLERRGITTVPDVCRDDAVTVLRDYARGGGLIYNP